ncbi:MAG: hypothetical protein IJP94_02490, partial [Clostridia bacterium]|nr:hypothetical protein [Clostridia bacterium]
FPSSRLHIKYDTISAKTDIRNVQIISSNDITSFLPEGVPTYVLYRNLSYGVKARKNRFNKRFN